jgi:hypothetical protein
MKTTVAYNFREDLAWKFDVFQTVVICGLIDFSSCRLIVNIEVKQGLALFRRNVTMSVVWCG